MINEDPLFSLICGLERSGTTVATELLRQHPKIDGRFECGFLLAKNPADFLGFEGYVNNLEFWGVTREDIAYICQAETWAEAYRRLLERSNIPNKSVWLYDKTPRYTLYLNKVRANPCVVTVGDPRAVYWSNKKRIETDLKEFCDYYLGYAKAWKAAAEQYTDRLLLVRHEQLCKEPESKSMRIYDFLGLEFKPEYILLRESAYNTYIYRGDGGITPETIYEYQGNITAEAEDYILEQTAEFACWHWE